MAVVKISRKVETVEEIEMEVSFPVYLKHKDSQEWTVKVIDLDTVISVDFKAIHTQTCGEYFLAKEEFILSTEEEFVKTFNKTIDELSKSILNSIEVNI